MDVKFQRRHDLLVLRSLQARQWIAALAEAPAAARAEAARLERQYVGYKAEVVRAKLSSARAKSHEGAAAAVRDLFGAPGDAGGALWPLLADARDLIRSAADEPEPGLDPLRLANELAGVSSLVARCAHPSELAAIYDAAPLHVRRALQLSGPSAVRARWPDLSGDKLARRLGDDLAVARRTPDVAAAESLLGDVIAVCEDSFQAARRAASYFDDQPGSFGGGGGPISNVLETIDHHNPNSWRDMASPWSSPSVAADHVI